MKKNVLILIFVAALGLLVGGQTKPNKELTLNVTVLKNPLFPLEPIPLSLNVENKTDAPVAVDTSISFSLPAVNLEIRKPQGEIVLLSQLSHVRIRSFERPTDLPPGGKFESTQLLSFRLMDYFGEPGEYQLRVSIAHPTGIDASAYEYIVDRTKNSPNRDFKLFPYFEWPQDNLEDFVNQFPQSSYASYARYTLGQRYMINQDERAAQHFRFLKEVPNFIFAKEVDFKLKQIESELKNKH